MSRAKILLFVFVLLTICFGSLGLVQEKPKPAPTATPKVVLITLDGVRWQDIFDGNDPINGYQPLPSRSLVPNLYRYFVDGGIAIGKRSRAETLNRAHVSLPGYLEIMTGRESRICLNNYCPFYRGPSLIDSFPDAIVFASWEKVQRSFNNESVFFDTGRFGRSEPFPDDVDFPDDFGDDEYRADQYTEKALLHYFSSHQQPTFLYLQLGDTDEWAHAGNDVFYWAELNAMDAFIGELVERLGSETIFIVSPDHGRNDNRRDHDWDPAAGRVWMMLRGPTIPKAGFVSYDRTVHLADIAPTVLELTRGKLSERSLMNYRK